MYIKIIRDMKKAKKVEFGIEITKPWSAEMYNHNEAVADVVRDKLFLMWDSAMELLEQSLELNDEGFEIDILDLDWDGYVNDELLTIQKAVTCYGFGPGYTVGAVAEQVSQEIIDAQLYRLNEIAEELELVLEKGFVGFN
jgi:hypothetical protein